MTKTYGETSENCYFLRHFGIGTVPAFLFSGPEGTAKAASKGREKEKLPSGISAFVGLKPLGSLLSGNRKPACSNSDAGAI